MSVKKTFFNWSSGKDSALALYYLLKEDKHSVEYLLTSISKNFERVSMHGVRKTLLEKQLDSIGIANGFVEIPENPTNKEYEKIMYNKFKHLEKQGFKYAAFGDIFLEDLRKYREQELEKANLSALFPLWNKDTKKLITEFIDLGFKAVVVCVNGTLLDKSFAGREIDMNFVNDLPLGIDPCGENGEFHTFCYDGPLFKKPILFEVGETVCRNYQNGVTPIPFWFCDLLPH